MQIRLLLYVLFVCLFVFVFLLLFFVCLFVCFVCFKNALYQSGIDIFMIHAGVHQTGT